MPKPAHREKWLRDQIANCNPSCCLIWNGQRMPGKWDYGCLWSESRPRKKVRAHVLSWCIHNKSQLPIGMIVRHTCDVPSCFNPYHLVVGTFKDNTADMILRGRHRPSGVVPYSRFCARGHEYTDSNTVFRKNGEKVIRRRCKQCELEAGRRRDARNMGTSHSEMFSSGHICNQSLPPSPSP